MKIQFKKYLMVDKNSINYSNRIYKKHFEHFKDDEVSGILLGSISNLYKKVWFFTNDFNEKLEGSNKTIDLGNRATFDIVRESAKAHAIENFGKYDIDKVINILKDEKFKFKILIIFEDIFMEIFSKYAIKEIK